VRNRKGSVDVDYHDLAQAAPGLLRFLNDSAKGMSKTDATEGVLNMQRDGTQAELQIREGILCEVLEFIQDDAGRLVVWPPEDMVQSHQIPNTGQCVVIECREPTAVPALNKKSWLNSNKISVLSCLDSVDTRL
jgi:hypothetical protein